MRNGKVEYYNDFDCTEPCLVWHTSGIRNIYVVRRKYSSIDNGRIQEFRLPYGEFAYALSRYDLEMNRVENAPFGFMPKGLELVVEVYSDSNKVYEDIIMRDKKFIGV